MTVNYTTLLQLPQPVDGTEAGTWGDVLNNAQAAYLDIAIAGGLAVTVTVADVTLAATQGTSSATNIGSTTSQYAILNVSGAMTAARNLIVPSTSKWYIINNTCSGGYTLTVKGAATTGVGIVNGEKALIAWNGSDFVKIASNQATALTGVLPNTSGGTGQSGAFTQYGVTYANATTTLATTSAGTSTTVLHGNASGAPTFGAVALTTDVSGTLGPANGGTGVANNAASTLTISGNFGTTVTVSGTTTVTLPTSGTLATLAGSETFTNKTLTNPTVTNYVETLYAIGNSSTAVTISLANGTAQTVTMTGNCTFTMPAVGSSKSFILIVNSGSGGFTGTFTSVKWPTNTAPTLTTTASRWDILTFVSDGTYWYGNYAQAYQ